MGRSRSGRVADMPRQVWRQDQREDQNAELAHRAVRRIGEYLTATQGRPVKIQGEHPGRAARGGGPARA